MNLKNYTSEVPAERSMMYIEQLLVNAGATNISKWYVEGEIAGMTFSMPINGIPINFKLPAKTDKVFAVMAKKYKKWTKSVEETCIKQAKRTAWKLLYEWVQIQVSMITVDQVEFMEVFLPYAYDGKQTLFESVKNTGYKALLGNLKGDNNNVKQQ